MLSRLAKQPSAIQRMHACGVLPRLQDVLSAQLVRQTQQRQDHLVDPHCVQASSVVVAEWLPLSAFCCSFMHLTAALCGSHQHLLHNRGVSLPGTRSPSCMATAGRSLQSVCSRHSIQGRAGQQAVGVGHCGPHAGFEEEARQHRCDQGECSPFP